MNTQIKLEVDGTDETSKIDQVEFVKPNTTGIGTFKVRLKNASGRISGLYKEGSVVKFFYDNIDASRRQFWGRVDYPKEIIGGSQFLELIGRHRSFILAETKVNYAATNADPADILRAIIDQLPDEYGFTKNNIETIGITVDVEWNYVNFWDCVIELCEKAQTDCRIDDDLDFYFHKRDTKVNNNEYIAEGINHIRTIEHGKDDFQEKTRVIAVGQDDKGLPIVYTAISSKEGVEKKEFFLRSASANTVQKVKDLAIGKLRELEVRPKQSRYISIGLETLESGQNIHVSVPRQQIFEIPRVLQVKIRFNTRGRSGGVRYETIMERELNGIPQILLESIRNERKVAIVQNSNKLNFSHNFDFNNDNLTESHSQTEVRDGLLKLSDSAFNNGRWISDGQTANNNITQVELRYIGKDLTDSKFYFSVMNGIDGSWELFTGKELLQSPGNLGKNLKLRVDLIKTDLNPQPELDSLLCLFS